MPARVASPGGLVALAALALAMTAPRAAHAESLPAGTIGAVIGPISGIGADAKRLGAGVQYGGQAMWQPMSTDQSLGWSVKWLVMFGRTYGGSAAQIADPIQTVQMDVMVGLRYRPWATRTRYLALRAGAELLRVNEPIPTSSDPGAEMRRAFLGGVAAIGLDQYLFGSKTMLNVDVRYGMIGAGPEQIMLVIGFGVTGP